MERVEREREEEEMRPPPAKRPAQVKVDPIVAEEDAEERNPHEAYDYFDSDAGDDDEDDDGDEWESIENAKSWKIDPAVIDNIRKAKIRKFFDIQKSAIPFVLADDPTWGGLARCALRLPLEAERLLRTSFPL